MQILALPFPEPLSSIRRHPLLQFFKKAQDDVFPQPILGLYADGSRIVDSESVKNRFPKLEYSKIPDIGHFLMLEKPGEFYELLLPFLDKLNY